MWNSLNKISINDKDTLGKLAQIKKILNEVVEPKEGLGIMGGKVGKAIFFLYYAKLIDKQEPYDYGLELLSSVFDNINKGFHFHTHASGLAGIGSTIELLVENDFLDANTNELLGELDNYLYELMIHEIKKGNYDFLHGAVGMGLYFLKRNTEESKKYLAELINDLDKFAVKDGKGTRWLSEIDREKHIKGYNLSLSHGLASIIVFLSKTYAMGIAQEKTIKLLEGSVKYLLNQEQDITKYKSVFPSWVTKEQTSTYSRLAWCYGDLGIGVALWLAGKNVRNAEWQNKATEIVLHTTNRREQADTGVVDAGICHGAAGIAHLYNRMYNYTNREEFKESAKFWFNKTLEMAEHKDTLSGYKAYRTEKYGGPYEDYGLLEGIAGIGLTLISAISDIEPKWDESLFIS